MLFPRGCTSELIASYRELVRLHTQLADDIARYKNEIHALLQVLFPEFSQVFADPCRPTALALLTRYPSAQAISAAAERLVSLAQASVSSGIALAARSKSLQVLCDQLMHTRENLAGLEAEIDKLLEHDPGSKGLQSVPEFGHKTIAVLRAELGEVARGSRAPIK